MIDEEKEPLAEGEEPGGEAGDGGGEGPGEWDEDAAELPRSLKIARIMLYAGAAGMVLDTIGWLMVSFRKIPEYPYFPIAVGCAAVYFGGRVIQLVKRRR